jgi:exodeoxyribonuclease V alpha subunit
MVTRNNYSYNVFNGDVGVVVDMKGEKGDLARRILFRTAKGFVAHPVDALAEDTTPAFAMTVHKSQGSEVDHVLLVLPEQPSPVLTRELLYTAVTRARRRVTIYGAPEILASGIAARIQRPSGLRDEL